MKKIAISTLGERFLLSNYGTFFQHYALRRVLREMGYVSFRISHPTDRYEVQGFLWTWLMDALRLVYWPLRRRPQWQVYCRKLVETDLLNMFFLSDYRRLIGLFHERQNFSDAVCGIMGGDQILGTKSDRLWLKDIPADGKCITYAASSDWTSRQVDAEWQDFATRQFKRFAAIGIREQAGVTLCRKLVDDGRIVEHVADPVMLLNAQDYHKIAARQVVFERPMLFCYLVNVRSSDDLMLSEYESLAKMLGCELKIAGVQGAELYIPARYRIRLRPTQFLRAMFDASYVVTNSYHGSVFAAILKKQFLSVWQNCLTGTNQNERQKEFMLQFGMSDRWLDWRSGAKKWYDELIRPVKWDSVHAGIDGFRRVSMNWLQEAVRI